MSADFDGFAVHTPSGPHVTRQAGLIHLGHYWTTTSRRSIKVAALESNPYAAVVQRTRSGWRIVGGPSTVLDIAHPRGLLEAPVAALLSPPAVARLGLREIDQLAGYALAARHIPAAFGPAGRVLIATRLTEHLHVDDRGQVHGIIGRWKRRTDLWPATNEPSGPVSIEDVPAEVERLATTAGEGVLGVMAGGLAVPVPAWWDPATSSVTVPRTVLSAVGAGTRSKACLTLDESEEIRPDRKVGVMLRGRTAVTAADSETVTFHLRIERVTHWRGFETDTVEEAA